MWQIIENIIGNVIGAIIISDLGIGSITIIAVSGKSHNPRKKWKILMVISIIAFVVLGSSTTTYVGGLSQTSSLGTILEWIFGMLFFIGYFFNWLNK